MMGRVDVASSDFRLTFAGDDVTWAGEVRPGLPILRWRDGSLCEPVIAYFGYSAEVDRVAVSSMKPEAYAIREWLAFLASTGRRWDEPDDLTMREWRESHRDAIESGDVEALQVERKLRSVFDFYRLLPEALPFDVHGERRRPFVGSLSEGRRISSKLEVGRFGKERLAWAGAKDVGKRSVRRPTPDVGQVRSILSWIRSAPEREPPPAEEWRRRVAALQAERDWSIGRCMVDGGLRAEEVCDLTLAALAKGLSDEGVIAAAKPSVASVGVNFALDDVGMAQEARTGLLGRLEGLEARHRRCLYVEVTGKGSKTRMAPFSIDLVRDILEVAVWSVRRGQVAVWAAQDVSFRPTGHVFLSFKTRVRLDPGTVSDLMKAAFVGAGVNGSGHRLRAHYGTLMAMILWDECFAMNGFRFDQTVANLVMERLAEAMGHAQVTTTIRHYVDMAILQRLGIGSEGRLALMRRLWNALVRRQAMLSEAKVSLIMKVIDALSDGRDRSDLMDVMELALGDDSLMSPLESLGVLGKPARH